MTASYFRNVITVEVLSDRPWGDEITRLDTVAYEITRGDSSGRVTRTISNEAVTAARMAQLLTAQGSDPEFLIGGEDTGWHWAEHSNERGERCSWSRKPAEVCDDGDLELHCPAGCPGSRAEVDGSEGNGPETAQPASQEDSP